MWQLKFVHNHKDCLYSAQLKKLSLTMYGYPLNSFVKNKVFFLNGIQIITGNPNKVQKYVSQIKCLKNIKHLEIIAPNAFIFQAKITKNISYYKKVYNQRMLYLRPVIHHDNKEIFEIASWDRELLQDVIKNIKLNKNTTFFKLCHIKRKIPPEIFIPQILPKLTLKQRNIVKLAKDLGYWQYPRKTNLTQLAKKLNISKSSLHERLRRVESRIINFFI